MIKESIKARTIFRLVLALSYFAVGIAHLISPSGFIKITPDWVPFPAYVIAITGVCEIAGAVALMTRGFRRMAGIALALYALCVFPANIKHALENIAIDGTHLSWWYHGPRLLFQPVLIWWALWAGCVVDWPFRATSKK